MENDLYRDDLKEHGHHPTGFCGFKFVFPAEFEFLPDRLISIYTKSINKPLFEIPTNETPKTLEKVSRPIFFMHIPKTAGTSFNNHVQQYFD
ncbi:MAG: hypothetical protein GKR95_10550 [Gammaproteobacteria bacterium]|nr:hypothetical protein [Gammaproteobacteria bacterium]